MGKYKAKAIQADLGISRHIQAYAGRHIQAYSEPCVTLTYSKPLFIQDLGNFRTSGIFRTLASSEPEAYSQSWHIQNPFSIRTLASSELEAYSELWYIQNARIIRTLERFVKIVNILYEINIMSFLIQV